MGIGIGIGMDLQQGIGIGIGIGIRVSVEHYPDNCKDTLAQLLQEEIANHNLTRQELVQKDEELGRAVDLNNQNVEESREQYFRQMDTITKLTDQLAKEEEEHAQAEHALRSLEEKVEKLESKQQSLW